MPGTPHKRLTSQPPLTIGRLAKLAGVHVETVRYYQRIGLIAAPERPLQGVRRYPDETIDRLRFIKRAQGLGFTLQETAELLALGEGRCTDVRRRAEAKRAQIQRQIRDLSSLSQTLDALIERCGTGDEPCPVVTNLLTRHDS